MSEIKLYTEDIQELFVRFLISSDDIFSRCMNIVEKENFSIKFRDTVDFLKSHSEKYNVVPTLDQLNAIGQLDLKPIENITAEHEQWFLDEFEQFSRHKKLERAIIESTDLLENHQYGEVENKIKDAVQTGLVKDLGLDYFDNPKERLEWIKAQGGATSTGFAALDRKLYGGLNRGEITIFAGGSGAGKSLFLQNLAVNWANAGLNVVYISLELSEQLISMRLDSMFSGYSAKDIMKNMDDVHLKVKMVAKKAGKLRVKYMPSGINTNDVRVFLREYEIQTGVKVDALLVDYLDLMSPISVKISADNMFVKDKYVSEELRNLAGEKEILMVTASQLNRAAVEEIEFDHSHIAGGISKINTSDNVIGIFTSNSMRENGRYQIQLMKTRSSSGVGSKIDLKFNVDTLRISDLDEDDDDAQTVEATSLIQAMQRKGVVPGAQSSPKETVNQGLELHNFLNKTKK